MTPDEKEIQEEKIRLMKIALCFGGAWALLVIALLAQIVQNTKP